jgi:small subunit ribosomal protein S6
MSATKQYELVYILAPEATEEQVQEIHQLVEGIATRLEGAIERTDAWGRRKLAYPIAGHKEGLYVVQVLNGGGEMVKEVDRRLKVNDLVIRHLIVRVDEDLRKADRAKSRRDAETARRREARGLSPEPAPIEAAFGGEIEVDDVPGASDRMEG